MNKITSTIAALMVLFSFSVGASTGYEHLNGQRLKLPGHAAIYLMDQGYRRHIPNPATYSNLFNGGISAHVDVHLLDIPEDTAISDGAILAKCPGKPHVYLIDGGEKRHITSPHVMNRYNFDWGKIRNVQCIVLKYVPVGSPIY